MVGEIKKGKYIYYHCTGNKGGNCKKGSYIREEKIEEKILQTLSMFRMSDDVFELAKRCFRDEIKSRNQYDEEKLKNLDVQIEKMKERSNKLFDLYLDGKVEDELYSKKSKEIESNLNDLISSRSAVARNGIDVLKYSELLFELFKMSSTIYSRLNNSEKRELLKMLCSNFSYDGENIRITIKKAFQPLVKIANLEKMGRSGLEPPTSPLSGVRSNHLS